MRLAAIVDEFRTEYKSLSKRDKPLYTEKIVRMIKHEYHGRFLKKATPQESSINNSAIESCFHWVEVDDEIAKDKVGHSFRTTPKKKPASGSTTNHASSGAPTQGGSWQSDPEEDSPVDHHHHAEVIMAPSNKRVKTVIDHDNDDNSTDGSSQEFEDSDLELLDSLP